METQRIVMTSTFYPPYHLGGDATHVRSLKAQLEARGHEVHVLHSIDAYRLKKGTRAAPKEDNVHPLQSSVGRLSPVRTYLTGRSSIAENALSKLTKEVNPDWIHHHNISLLGAGIVAIGKAPRIYTAHDYWLVCPRSDLMYLGRNTCEKQRCNSCSVRTRRPPQLWRSDASKMLFRSFDAVIAPSQFMASRLSAFGGIDSEVLTNFAEPRTHSGEKGDRFVFVGVLEKGKGLDIALEAFSGDERLRLDVLGSGSMEKEVDKAERETGGRIRRLGFLTGEPLFKVIAEAPAIVQPSRGNDNCPLSCIEALSLGTPLIVSEKGGLPELVRDPDCGLVAKLSAESVREKALEIATDAELRTNLAANALSRFNSHHRPEAYLERYLAIGKELA